MIFAEKTITLKDGRQAVLRAPEKADAQVLLQYLKDTAGETEFLIRYPEEVTMTIEQEEAYIENQRQSQRDCTILAFVDGVHAGNCGIGVNGKKKVRHYGTLGIALRKEFWGSGLGTVLMQEAIDVGKEMGLHHLELEVFAPNERAIALYTKMGFRIVATRPFAAKTKDGAFMDEHIMQLVY